HDDAVVRDGLNDETRHLGAKVVRGRRQPLAPRVVQLNAEVELVGRVTLDRVRVFHGLLTFVRAVVPIGDSQVTQVFNTTKLSHPAIIEGRELDNAPARTELADLRHLANQLVRVLSKRLSIVRRRGRSNGERDASTRSNRHLSFLRCTK